MAHSNINQRQAKVRQLMKNKTLTSTQITEIAQEFSCHKSAIRADVIHVNHPEGGYHVSASLKKYIIKRDKSICQYCKKHTSQPIVEHKIPVAYGGKATKENLVTSCQSCNMKKRYKDKEKFK